jgi:hypothetical protein
VKLRRRRVLVVQEKERVWPGDVAVEDIAMDVFHGVRMEGLATHETFE